MKKKPTNSLLNFFHQVLSKAKSLWKIVLFLIPRTILQRYIFVSIFPYFLLGVLILSLINFFQYLSDFVELAIQYQASLGSVLVTVLYLIPFLMTFTIPVGALIGVILALGHLNQNNELLAIRIHGISYLHLFAPVVSFGIFIFLFQLAFFQWILPWGNTHFLEEKYKMLQQNPLSQIQKKQQFSDGIREIKIASINEQTLYGITFVDSQNNTLYYAKTGSVKPSIDQHNFNIPITLYNAVSVPFVFDTPSSRTSLKFFNKITVYIRAINVQSIIPQGNELIGLFELYKIIKISTLKNVVTTLRSFHRILKENYEFEKRVSTSRTTSQEDSTFTVENLLQKFQVFDQRILAREEVFLFQRKISFCIDTILMVCIGIPLSLFRRRHGKDIAVGVSILCVFIFNVLLAASAFAFKQHFFGPYLGAWAPSILIMLLMLLLFVWKLKENN